MKIRFCPFILTVLGSFLLPVTLMAAKPSFSSVVQPFFENYCLDCHDGETKKGNLSFEELTVVNTENFTTWKSIWEQVALKEMPPRKKKNQPGAIDRRHVSQWILGEMEQLMKD